MSLDKAIEHGKEHRKPYRGSKATDAECRNHGSDSWSAGNRMHGNRKRAETARQKMREYLEEEGQL